MPTDHRSELKKIRTFPQLVRYLRDEMGWPIDQDSFEDDEDLYYDFTPEELGLDTTTAAKIEQIRRLRRLSVNQPFGIFFVKFAPGRLPVIALRRILNEVVLKKRATAKAAERTAWAADDLLFVSNYGEGNERQISFAHFSQAETKHDLPTLKVLGWDNLDTPMHLDAIAEKLTTQLAWPKDETDIEAWRKSWRSAFLLRHREVVTTSHDLSIRLAELARAIRDRIKTALAHEHERGPLTMLMKAFQEALIHDLDVDGFADMYAQTIAYGLLSARIADPHKKTADDFAAHMRTNPFLKELMQTFLHVGGRRGKAGGPGIDFDELGVSEVVELLDDANLEAVVMDFGDLKPEEDPVIHFYELFLKEYDKQQKVSRGVFYTPRPVVSYIVRSVDGLLRTEFGLADGLADTTSWGEMAKHHKDLKVPEGVPPEQAFVQILDPATGTGTFLVEVIDLIHTTLIAKWKSQGHDGKKMAALWNEYVPKYLLPRLHGYELLMAPYAIAHLKIGLKLYETGYHFGSDERARIYLTNALEPVHDFSGTFEFAIPALAHEAQAVNHIKRKQRFTVVIGNPPYSGEGMNKGEWIRSLIEIYMYVDGAHLGEKGKKNWLQDDYVKFIRYAQFKLDESRWGILAFINNHSFLNNPTFRGMRASLLNSFRRINILDLHGNSKKKERCPDGTADENVFDIQQGVSVGFFRRTPDKDAKQIVAHSELWGMRSDASKLTPCGKNGWLLQHSNLSTNWMQLSPNSPFYLFVPQDADLRSEYENYWKMTKVMPHYGAGIITSRDHFVTDFEDSPLMKRLELFRDSSVSNEWVRANLGVRDNSMWSMAEARKEFRKHPIRKELFVDLLYRPFDIRRIYFETNVVFNMRIQVMRHMLAGRNVGLITARSNKSPTPDHFFCSNLIIETKCGESTTQSSFFPLFLYPEHAELTIQQGHHLNLSPSFVAAAKRLLGVEAGTTKNRDAEEIFHYIYAVFYSQRWPH